MNVKKIIFLALCLIIILTSSVFPMVTAAGAVSNDYDYSKPGSYFNTFATAIDLIDYLGFAVSEEERAYLDAYCDFKISYERVTNKQVKILVDDGSTKIEAAPYTYTDADGREVTWLPVSAAFSKDGTEHEKTFSGEEWYVLFDGVLIDESTPVSVSYRISESSAFVISADDVNAILDLAYDEACAIEDSLDFYLENSEGVLEYYDKLASYEQYLEEKYIYDQKKSEYNQYLSDYEDYEVALAKYNKYLSDLEEYQNIKDTNEKLTNEYNSAKERYDAYLVDRALAEEQLKTLNDGLMNCVTLPSDPPQERQLYGSIFASLMQEVVANKDKLTKVGATMEDINATQYATEKIRAILKPADGKNYVDLKTFEEKYAFYVNNYDALLENFLLITRSIYSIYSAPGVKLTLHAAAEFYDKEDKTEKLAIFIAQLIYFSEALCDEPLTFVDHKGVARKSSEIKLGYRDSYGVNFGQNITDDKPARSLNEILGEDANFVKDTGRAKPISLVVVDEPELPELLEEKDLPTPVVKPTAPTEIKNPGNAPTEIKEPSLPAGMPTDFDWQKYINDNQYNTVLNGLHTAHKSSIVTDREDRSDDLSFRPQMAVEKRRSSETVTVNFVDSNGNLLQSQSVDKGDSVIFGDENTPLPTKDEDISATYRFDAWVTATGEKFDLYSVTEDVTLYPSFAPVYKEYDIVGTDSKYLDVSIPSQTLDYLPLSHFAQLAKDNRADLRLSAGNVQLRISYVTLSDLEANGVSYLDVDVDTMTGTDYSCRVRAYTSSGAESDVEEKVRVFIPCADEAFGRKSVLTYTASDGSVKTEYKIYNAATATSPATVEFYATTGLVYSLKLNNNYEITHNSNVAGIVTYPQFVAAGDTVTLEINAPAGKSVELYYTLLSDGSRHMIEGNSFIMPEGNIKLGLKTTDLEYTVKFVSDGKVLSEKIYKYGDTVTLPNVPTKVNDGTYSYKFTGWSPEVSATVTGEVTYVAQFEATLLEIEEYKLTKFDILFYTGLGILILGLLAGATFITISIIKKSKKKSKPDSAGVTNTAKTAKPAEKHSEKKVEKAAPAKVQNKADELQKPMAEERKAQAQTQAAATKTEVSKTQPEKREHPSLSSTAKKPTLTGTTADKKPSTAQKTEPKREGQNPNTRVEK